MRLALIISSLQTGGAERVLSELANVWVSKGYEVSLITLAGSDNQSIYPLDPRIHLIHLNQMAGDSVPLLLRLKTIGKRILKLRKALKSIRADVIISFIDVMNVTTLLASRMLKIPVIVTERTHPSYHQLPKFYQFLRRLTYPWADKVISQTSSASDYFSRLPKRQKGIIPNAVKKPVVQKNETDILKPVHHIVSVGRLCPYKGFQILIQAFSEILPHNPNLNLTIYGDGVMRASLEMLIQELKLTEHVFLPGTIQDIETALYNSDLFVFPSFYEGFPNALCEAMAVGLPVIASNCSGSVEIVRDGIDGRLFGVGDVHQLTRLLQELIEDSSQRVKLSKGACGVVDRFSQASNLEKWDTVLAEVVNR